MGYGSIPVMKEYGPSANRIRYPGFTARLRADNRTVTARLPRRV